MTVAVLDPETRSCALMSDSDVDIRTTRGQGPGGQHRNKVESCVVARHLPTGLTVRIDIKSQHEGRKRAKQMLAALVDARQKAHWHADRQAHRRQQLGSGMRGDKVRTYRVRDDRVVDHRTGET